LLAYFDLASIASLAKDYLKAFGASTFLDDEFARSAIGPADELLLSNCHAVSTTALSSPTAAAAANAAAATAANPTQSIQYTDDGITWAPLFHMPSVLHTFILEIVYNNALLKCCMMPRNVL